VSTSVEQVDEEEDTQEESEPPREQTTPSPFRELGSELYGLFKMALHFLFIGTIMLFAFQHERLKPVVDKVITQIQRLAGVDTPEPESTPEREQPEAKQPAAQPEPVSKHGATEAKEKPASRHSKSSKTH
jgi:hypothetical protein